MEAGGLVVRGFRSAPFSQASKGILAPGHPGAPSFQACDVDGVPAPTQVVSAACESPRSRAGSRDPPQQGLSSPFWPAVTQETAVTEDPPARLC